MASTTPSIFISYTSADSEWTTKLARALSALGMNVTVAEEFLHTGDSWEAQFRQALEDVDLLVAIIPEKVGVTPWIAFGMGAARALLGNGKKRRILPVVPKDVSEQGVAVLASDLKTLRKGAPGKVARQIAETVGSAKG